MAERVGFEPTCPLLAGKTLSRRPRYDHFGTSPRGMGLPLDQVAVRFIPSPALGLLFLTSFAPKEFAQHSRALIGEHSWDYLRMMVQPGMVQDVQN